ncbi:MAG: hypothetical protein ACK4MI_13415 [Brevundimonas sp.]|uniref:hypothetical protein n=1 Tax=Brevundimonas sp. TaxID=1871086 RepID=UPI0028D7792E|nr:hypothetical protein [uncultured Brevundimonas sp.]
MGLSIVLAAVAAATAVTAWEQPATTAPLDRADLVAVIDYCVAVVEADMLDAAPLANGPDGFERTDGRYGGQNWFAGSADGRAIVAQPSGTHCSAYAVGFDAADAADALAGREGYRPDNEASTAFLRLFEGRGGVRAGWSVLGDDEGLQFFVNGVKFEPQVSEAGPASIPAEISAQGSVPLQALGDALQFCLAVGEAARLGAPPVKGPATFQEDIGPYGHKTWQVGEPSSPSAIGISARDASCNIVAKGGPHERVASWMQARADYAPVDDKRNHSAKKVGDGWVHIAWSDFSDETTLIMVTSRKGEERTEMF